MGREGGREGGLAGWSRFSRHVLYNTCGDAVERMEISNGRFRRCTTLLRITAHTYYDTETSSYCDFKQGDGLCRVASTPGPLTFDVG